MIADRNIPLIFFLLLTVHVTAQEFLVQEKSWSVEDGLPDREVNTLHEDSRGFIWVGTRQGLCRFDGYEFRIFDQRSDGFQSNYIWRILEDAGGYFWILPLPPFTDFDIWHPVTRERTTFREKFGRTTALPEYLPIQWVTDAGDRTVFTLLSSPARLLSYHPDSGLQTIPMPADCENLELFKVGESLWCMSYDQTRILEINRQAKLLRTFGEPGFSYIISSAREHRKLPFTFNQKTRLDDKPVKTWLVDRDGNVRPLPRYYKSNLLLPGPAIPDIDEDLLFSIDGLFRLDGTLICKFSAMETFPPNSVLVDRRGLVWVGGGFGFRQLTLSKNRFQRYLDAAVQPGQKMQYPSMRAMVVTDNQLMVNWEAKGHCRVDLKSGNILEIFPHLRGEVFESFLHLKNGGFAIGHMGISLYGRQDELQECIWMDFYTHALAEPVPGMLWLGTSQGLRVMNLTERKPQLYDKLNGFEDLAKTEVYHIGQARDGTWYLCTGKGFFKVDVQRGVLAQYGRRQTGKYYLPFEAINHFAEDEENNFWLGTRGGGLIQLLPGQGSVPGEKAGKHFRQFTREQGLSNNNIYTVYEDEDDNLWLSSDFGLMNFNKKTRKVNTFLEQDGISHNEFNAGSHARGPDGKLYFGGLNGVTSFHPRELSRSRSQEDPRLAVVSFQKFDGSKNQLTDLTAELLRRGGIVLQPADRYFQLDYSLLNYLNVYENRYAWQFAGEGENWNYTEERALRFGRLPYGRHQLRIKAQDVRGSWSKNELIINIEVRRPFYLRAWFFILMLLAAVLGVIAFLRVRTRQLRRQKMALEQEVTVRTETIRQQAEELRTLDQLKSRFFTNVSHELRTPLTLMLGPAESLLSRDYWKDKDRRLLGLLWQNARHLLKLVNEILDLSRLESSGIEVAPAAVRVQDFLQPLVAQFSSYGASESVRLVFEYRASTDLILWMDGGKVEKIIHNFLGNALKFTPSNKQVVFRFEEEEDSVLISVRDEGPGIHPADLPRIFDRFYQSSQAAVKAQGGSGIGLALCRELALLLEGEVWAESCLGEGSTFFFRFPKKVAPSEAAETAVPVSFLPPLPEVAVEEAGMPPPGSAHILLAEDNADLRNYMQLLLGGAYTVQTAENGLAAWELLQQGPPPDLIITDLMMPLMNGQELLARIKGEDNLRHIPVIVLTARSDAKVKLELLRIGVDDYLTKPFMEQELLARMENLLRHYQERLDFAPLSTADDVGLPLISREDSEWLKALEGVFLENVGNIDFNMELAASRFNMGERHFRRRIRQLTGLTPTLYMRELRLQKARSFLLEQKFYTVKETAFAAGFMNADYFAKLYQERFGLSPSEDLKNGSSAGLNFPE